MLLGSPWSNVYIGASIVQLIHEGTKQQMGYGLARWLQRCQSSPTLLTKVVAVQVRILII